MPDSNGVYTDADDYQDATKETEIYTDAATNFVERIYPQWYKDESSNTPLEARDFLCLMYCTGKLNGEAGEVAEIIFKAFRGNIGEGLTEEETEKLIKELGDVMWYVARLADLVDIRLSDVMTTNINKLRDRQKRGKLHGYGDDR